MDNKDDQSLLEFVAEASDIAIEALFDGASDFFGPALSAFKAIRSFRDKALARKLHQFLKEPAMLRSAKALNLRNRMFRDDSEMRRVGETILLILDKVTDLEKPKLLGQVAAAWLDDEIDVATFLRLAHAIDISSTLDLQVFLNGKGAIIDDGTLWPQRLAGVGLIATYSSGALGGGGLDYEQSPLGTSLLHVVNYCAAV